MQERRQLVSSCQEKAAEQGWERTGTINRRQKKEISFPLDILVLFSFKKSILLLTAGCSDSLCDALLFFLVCWMPGPYKKVLQFTSSPTQLRVCFFLEEDPTGLPQSVNLYLQEYSSKAGTNYEAGGQEASVNSGEWLVVIWKIFMIAWAGDSPSCSVYRWLLQKRKNTSGRLHY